jgi:hypothetical protein
MALPLEHDVERLEEGQACFQEGGQLLAEDEEHVGRDPGFVPGELPGGPFHGEEVENPSARGPNAGWFRRRR